MTSKKTIFIPPVEVAKCAKKGLELREKFHRGGTEVGYNRAKQLSAREELDLPTIKKMHSYFARHSVDKNASHFGDENNPSKGYIAWLLWGGDPAQRWIDEILAENT